MSKTSKTARAFSDLEAAESQLKTKREAAHLALGKMVADKGVSSLDLTLFETLCTELGRGGDAALSRALSAVQSPSKPQPTSQSA